MANTPFRGGPKIGRNDPCFCGSGRKFKHCHGGVQHTLPALLARERVEKEIIEQGRRLFEKHKAQELQRQKQQGLGRPIISIDHKGHRFIAVGNRLHYGKWKTFPDFLADYIKQTLGGDGAMPRLPNLWQSVIPSCSGTTKSATFKPRMPRNQGSYSPRP